MKRLRLPTLVIFAAFGSFILSLTLFLFSQSSILTWGLTSVLLMVPYFFAFALWVKQDTRKQYDGFRSQILSVVSGNRRQPDLTLADTAVLPWIDLVFHISEVIQNTSAQAERLEENLKTTRQKLYDSQLARSRQQTDTQFVSDQLRAQINNMEKQVIGFISQIQESESQTRQLVQTLRFFRTADNDLAKRTAQFATYQQILDATFGADLISRLTETCSEQETYLDTVATIFRQMTTTNQQTLLLIENLAIELKKLDAPDVAHYLVEEIQKLVVSSTVADNAATASRIDAVHQAVCDISGSIETARDTGKKIGALIDHLQKAFENRKKIFVEDLGHLVDCDQFDSPLTAVAASVNTDLVNLRECLDMFHEDKTEQSSGEERI